jgi:hypothetical protein
MPAETYKTIFAMTIKEYRLTSMEEPTDEMLHELMEQVADSARKSFINAQRVLQEKMQETIAEIRRRKSSPDDTL